MNNDFNEEDIDILIKEAHVNLNLVNNALFVMNELEEETSRSILRDWLVTYEIRFKEEDLERLRLLYLTKVIKNNNPLSIIGAINASRLTIYDFAKNVRDREYLEAASKLSSLEIARNSIINSIHAINTFFIFSLQEQ